MLENILCDRRRAALESVVSSNDSQASLYFCNKQGGVLFIWISVIRFCLLLIFSTFSFVQ